MSIYWIPNISKLIFRLVMEPRIANPWNDFNREDVETQKARGRNFDQMHTYGLKESLTITSEPKGNFVILDNLK